MKVKTRHSRAFELSSRAPFKSLLKDPLSKPTTQFLYKTLVEVSCFHEFYNANDFRCPGFEFELTELSYETVQGLGLIFKTNPFGFSILYDSKHEKKLLDYVRRHCDDYGCWTRLSVVGLMSDPYFINLSQLPLGLNQVRENLYFNNTHAHLDGGTDVILNQGEFVSDLELLPTVPNQIQVEFEDGVNFITVHDVSGRRVLCLPRCVPVRMLLKRNIEQITCEQIVSFEEDFYRENGRLPLRKCRDSVYIDFYRLSEGYYRIEQKEYLDGEGKKPIDVLYSQSQPVPLVFIDLMLTRPEPETAGIYPIDISIGEESIDSVHYSLRFDQRRTIWIYLVILYKPEPVQQMSIVDTANGTGTIIFHGPEPVVLPNGKAAYAFISDQDIPLQQQSEYKFELQGVVGDQNRQRSVSVKRLPVAGFTQVYKKSRFIKPISDPLGHAYSEIYVYV